MPIPTPTTTTVVTATPTPINVTRVIMSKMTRTVAANTTKAVHHVVTTAGGAPSLTLGDLVMAILGIAIPLIVVWLLFFRGRGRVGGGAGASARRLADAIRDPSVDAVGVILHQDTATASIVPLRRVENLYVSVDPSNPVLVIPNPYAQPYSLEGKPLMIALALGRCGQTLNVPLITQLGFAQIAIDDPLWRETGDPWKALDKLITKLATSVGMVTARVRVTPTTTIALQMAIPKVLANLIATQLDTVNTLVIHLSDLGSAISDIARSLGIHRALELKAKSEAISKVVIALAIAGGVLLILFLLQGALGRLLPHG